MPSRRAVLSGLAATALAPAGIARAAIAPPDRLAPLREAMSKGRFIAYHPTGSAIWNGVEARASDASIEADLAALRPWFDGLITYGASNGAERVPAIAARLGFRAVIQGVWNPGDVAEIERALSAWQANPKLVAGLSLGNELVLSRRGTWGDLGFAISRVRQWAPGLALSTTEPFAQFLDDPEAASTLAEMDFLLANVHPIFQPWFFSAQAPNWAEFVARVGARLAARFAGPVLIKETGVPTGPEAAGFTPYMQRDFYRALEQRQPPSPRLGFGYFAAFDLPWAAFQASPLDGKSFAPEAHWGLFTAAREPKPVLAEMMPLEA